MANWEFPTQYTIGFFREVLKNAAGRVLKPFLLAKSAIKVKIFHIDPPAEDKAKFLRPLLFSTDLDGTLIKRSARYDLMSPRTRQQIRAFEKRGGITLLNTSYSYWISEMVQKQLGKKLAVSACNGTYVTVPDPTDPKGYKTIVDQRFPVEALKTLEKVMGTLYPKEYKLTLCGTGRNFYMKDGGAKVRAFQAQQMTHGRMGHIVKVGMQPYKGHIDSTYLVRLVPVSIGNKSSGSGIMDWFSKRLSTGEAREKNEKEKRKAKSAFFKETISKLMGDFSHIEDPSARVSAEQEFYNKVGVNAEEIARFRNAVDISIGDFGIELNAKGFSKGTAIRAVQGYLAERDINVADKNIFVAGDGISDVAQFAEAATMDNIIPIRNTKNHTNKQIDRACKNIFETENARLELEHQNKTRIESYRGLASEALSRCEVRKEEAKAGVELDERQYNADKLLSQDNLAELKQAIEAEALKVKLDDKDKIKGFNFITESIGSVLDHLDFRMASVAESCAEREKFTQAEVDKAEAEFDEIMNVEEEQVKKLFGTGRKTRALSHTK